MLDEDEVTEVVAFGGEVRQLPVGLDHAEALNRQRYVTGAIDVDEYEREVARLLCKRVERGYPV